MQTSPLMLEEIRRGMKPVERLSLADYCDKRRIIPPGKPMPGPWKTSRVEPWRAVYSYFDNPRTREMGIMGAAQTAKSETQTNTIAKTIEIDPKPILIIKPSLNNLVDGLLQEFADAVVDDFRSLSDVLREWNDSARKGGAAENTNLAGPLQVMEEVPLPPTKKDGEANQTTTKKFCMFCGESIAKVAKFCPAC